MRYDMALSKGDAVILEKVKRAFFADSPIKLSEDGGQSVTEDGQLVLGCRAGISLDIFNLLHEMSHLVEIDDQRSNAFGWGLSFGREVNIPGYNTFYEPTTWQATQREMRVMAFQANLMKRYGRKPDFDYFAKLCDHVVDYLNVPFKNETRYRILAERIKKLSLKPEYSFAAFKIEWVRKNEILRRKLLKPA